MFEFLWEYSNNTYKVQVPLACPSSPAMYGPYHLPGDHHLGFGVSWPGLSKWIYTEKHGFIFHKLEQTSDTDFQCAFFFFFWCCYCFLLKSFGNLFILAFIALSSLCTVLHIMKGVNIVLDYCWQVICYTPFCLLQTALQWIYLDIPLWTRMYFLGSVPIVKLLGGRGEGLLFFTCSVSV